MASREASLEWEKNELCDESKMLVTMELKGIVPSCLLLLFVPSLSIFHSLSRSPDSGFVPEHRVRSGEDRKRQRRKVGERTNPAEL